jgi:hypothetical protein
MLVAIGSGFKVAGCAVRVARYEVRVPRNGVYGAGWAVRVICFAERVSRYGGVGYVIRSECNTFRFTWRGLSGLSNEQRKGYCEELQGLGNLSIII